VNEPFSVPCDSTWIPPSFFQVILNSACCLCPAVFASLAINWSAHWIQKYTRYLQRIELNHNRRGASLWPRGRCKTEVRHAAFVCAGLLWCYRMQSRDFKFPFSCVGDGDKEQSQHPNDKQRRCDHEFLLPLCALLSLLSRCCAAIFVRQLFGVFSEVNLHSWSLDWLARE